MRKTVSAILVLALAVTSLAAVVKGRLASREGDFADNAEERNTDYMQTTDGRQEASQLTHVYVGTGTDFGVGAKLVVDVTVLEWDTENYTVFAVMSGYGYMWCSLHSSENLAPGRHVIEWVNQSSSGVSYNLNIDGRLSVVKYQTWWQLRDASYPLYIGSRYKQSGWTFKGLYHSISLYDASGKLRHKWIPDPSGLFYDEMDGVYATRAGGYFRYGDLSND